MPAGWYIHCLAYWRPSIRYKKARGAPLIASRRYYLVLVEEWNVPPNMIAFLFQ